MHERIVALYEENAAVWDERRGRTMHDGETGPINRFLDAVTPCGRVLDLGCGNGFPVAKHMLARGFGVTGVDSSESLIGLARKRLPEGEWVTGDMRTLALGRRFDGLIAWYSFFHLHFDDQRAMFPIFANHLKPGAPLSFADGCDHGEAIGEWQGEPLYHASLAPEEYCHLLKGHDFDLLMYQAGEPLAPGPSFWLARRR